MITQLAILLLALVFANLFDALCDRFRDSQKNSAPYRFFAVKLNKPGWYLGNPWYEAQGLAFRWKNNGVPWQSDYWHSCKLFRVYCYCVAICTGFSLSWGWWAYLLLPGLAFVGGKSFWLFYHKVFPDA
jgi:hypothetical protein